jgi:glycerol kinase
MLEGFVATAGTLIDWLGMGMGITNAPKALNDLASECTDSGGVVFIPTPAGIRFPYFNARMRASVLGLSLDTHRRHLARAVLEGLALRMYDILDGIEHDAKVKIRQIRVDGGVSRSDVLMQCLADITNIPVYRSIDFEMTSRGAAYLAGLGIGFWRGLAEVAALDRGYDAFTPAMEPGRRSEIIRKWRRAVDSVMRV